MSAVKSVLLAIVVATRKKDQAGKVLMHVQRACAFAQGQLNQLESYATETDVRWTETAQVDVYKRQRWCEDRGGNDQFDGNRAGRNGD